MRIVFENLDDLSMSIMEMVVWDGLVRNIDMEVPQELSPSSNTLHVIEIEERSLRGLTQILFQSVFRFPDSRTELFQLSSSTVSPVGLFLAFY